MRRFSSEQKSVLLLQSGQIYKRDIGRRRRDEVQEVNTDEIKLSET